jgi:hypothetical protein
VFRCQPGGYGGEKIFGPHGNRILITRSPSPQPSRYADSTMSAVSIFNILFFFSCLVFQHPIFVLLLLGKESESITKLAPYCMY